MLVESLLELEYWAHPVAPGWWGSDIQRLHPSWLHCLRKTDRKDWEKKPQWVKFSHDSSLSSHCEAKRVRRQDFGGSREWKEERKWQCCEKSDIYHGFPFLFIFICGTKAITDRAHFSHHQRSHWLWDSSQPQISMRACSQSDSGNLQTDLVYGIEWRIFYQLIIIRTWRACERENQTGVFSILLRGIGTENLCDNNPGEGGVLLCSFSAY